MTNERDKALEYRRKMQARENDRLARERALAGDEQKANEIRENFAALLPWDGWEPEKKVNGDSE